MECALPESVLESDITTKGFYMAFYSKFLAIALVGSLSSLASAGPLNDYNLILFGDLNVSGGSGHIEGKAFIGGDVVNASIFAQKEPANSTADTVKVVGNFKSNNGTHIDRGYLAYQGNFSGPTNICNGAGLTPNGCVKKVTDNSLTAERAVLLSQLQAESAYYKGLSTSDNTALIGDMNNKKFSYTGSGNAATARHRREERRHNTSTAIRFQNRKGSSRLCHRACQRRRGRWFAVCRSSGGVCRRRQSQLWGGSSRCPD